MDTPNHKFDEMLLILDKTFDHLKAQASTVEAYDSFSKQINMRFQCVFVRLDDFKFEALLASKAGPSHVRE